jgi:hypothetical protein
MKVLIFIPCHFGLWSLISNHTALNMQRAIGMLEQDACDFIYLAVDYGSDEKQQLIEDYLQSNLKQIEPQARERIHIATSSEDYFDMLVEYIKQMNCDEICVDILALASERMLMHEKINTAADNYNGKLPLIFTRDSHWLT